MDGCSFVPSSGMLSADFAVDSGKLKLNIAFEGLSRTLIFHDRLEKGGSRFRLFHEKTRFYTEDSDTAAIRTSAVDSVSGAPLPGVVLTYRFRFEKDVPAFTQSVEIGSDENLSGVRAYICDFSPGGDFQSFTGHEYDADGKPFSRVFPVPEKNPDALGYDELAKVTRHTAWEKMKTRPHSFRRALTLKDGDGCVTVCGGTPTFNVEGGFVSVFPDLPAFDGDLSFFSGEGSLEIFFAFTKDEDVSPLLDRYGAKDVPCVKAEGTSGSKTETVKSGKLSFRLRISENGVTVGGPSGDVSGFAPFRPLFEAELFDTEHKRNCFVDSRRGWSDVKVYLNGSFLRICLNDPDCGRIRGISIVAEGFADPERDRIEWKTRIVNKSEKWSVRTLGYPSLSLYGYKTAFFPEKGGRIINDFCKRGSFHTGKYPLGVKVNMPFAAMYTEKDGLTGKGVYVGVHDAGGSPKFFNSAGGRNGACFTAKCRAPYEGKSGNSFTLPGRAVWQAFEGNWYDACVIYRSFVEQNADWIAHRGREDSPSWLGRIPVWLMHFMPNDNPDADPFPVTLREKNPDTHPDEWFTKAIRFKNETGVPVAYHLYNWHWAPFNNDNPNYFPVHHDLLKGVESLRNAGIKVVPYMAAYSFDMHDSRADDFRFTEEALPNAAKTKDGGTVCKSYASREPDGSLVRFARMCPTTAFWKNEVAGVVKKLWSVYGADGIYLDVVSAQYDGCYDETHAHEQGYGAYWQRAYHELIAGLRAEAPSDFAIVSESTSEVYTDALDGMLAWTWSEPDEVPAFMSVYSGRISVFGSVISGNKRGDAPFFRYQIAREFVYGQSLGWIHPEIVDDGSMFPYLKKLAVLRYRFADFFAGAKMLRPPFVRGDAGRIDTTPCLRGTFLHHEKRVLSGVFEGVNGERILFVFNTDDVTHEAELVFKTEEYSFGLSDECEGEGFEIKEIRTENGYCVISCRIEGTGYGIIRRKGRETE